MNSDDVGLWLRDADDMVWEQNGDIYRERKVYKSGEKEREGERPLTHYKKKCEYFSGEFFLRNIGIQQTTNTYHP